MIKKCSKCGSWWLKKAMITNKKTGDFFCPKCVAFDALKTVWNLQNSVNLLQACVDAKMPDEDESEEA